MDDIIERLETRLTIKRQDSKLCSYRADYYADRRKELQDEIRAIKQQIKDIREGVKAMKESAYYNQEKVEE